MRKRCEQCGRRCALASEQAGVPPWRCVPPPAGLRLVSRSCPPPVTRAGTGFPWAPYPPPSATVFHVPRPPPCAPLSLLCRALDVVAVDKRDPASPADGVHQAAATQEHTVYHLSPLAPPAQVTAATRSSPSANSFPPPPLSSSRFPCSHCTRPRACFTLPSHLLPSPPYTMKGKDQASDATNKATTTTNKASSGVTGAATGLFKGAAGMLGAAGSAVTGVASGAVNATGNVLSTAGGAVANTGKAVAGGAKTATGKVTGTERHS